MDANWTTLVSTVIGAALAVGATVIAHVLASRDSRRREGDADRRRCYLDYALAAEAAHDALRRVADAGRPHGDLAVEVRTAMSESGIYGAREAMLVLASAPMNSASEVVLQRLREMRQAIRAGAVLNTLPYHNVYHPFANALWHLRRIARTEFGHSPLTPEDLGKTTWDSQEGCTFCLRQLAANPATDPGDHEVVATQ